MRKRARVSHGLRIMLGGLWILLAGCQGESTVSRLAEQTPTDSQRPMMDPAMRTHRENMNPRLLRRFAPLRVVEQKQDDELVNLGRVLFFDPRLSRTESVSCNSCHPLDRFGTTGTAVSVGVDGRLGRRNAPTVFNAAGHFREFWDGRAADLEEQASGPLMNPSEMGMSPAKLLQKLEGIAGYRAAFARAFPRESAPISMIGLTKALAAFERGLNTPSRWDRYLEGNVAALTQREKAGARLFANLGCLSCHTGAYIAGGCLQGPAWSTPGPIKPIGVGMKSPKTRPMTSFSRFPVCVTSPTPRRIFTMDHPRHSKRR